MTGRGQGAIHRGLWAMLAAATLAGGAEAETAGTPLGPVLFDRDKPIEITADRLDVDQTAKTAVFDGNVDAVQGEVRLRADTLRVYYDEPAGGAAGAAPEAAASAAASEAPVDPLAGGGRIRLMEVEGAVHVSSPTETASGKTAVYDVDRGTITLVGDVVLTRGDNVIRGSKLSIDVESGRSVIESQSSGPGGSGRVKGLFVPKKDEGAPAPAGAGAAP